MQQLSFYCLKNATSDDLFGCVLLSKTTVIGGKVLNPISRHLSCPLPLNLPEDCGLKEDQKKIMTCFTKVTI